MKQTKKILQQKLNYWSLYIFLLSLWYLLIIFLLKPQPFLRPLIICYFYLEAFISFLLKIFPSQKKMIKNS